MRLGIRWSAVLGLACLVVLGLSMLALELAMARQQREEARAWEAARRDAVALRVSLYAQEAFGSVQNLLSDPALVSLLRERNEVTLRQVVDWADQHRREFRLDEILVLAEDGTVVTSGLEPAAFGLVHPEADYLRQCRTRNPVLWQGWRTEGDSRPWLLGGVGSIVTPTEIFRVVGGRLAEPDQMAQIAVEAGCASLSWGREEGALHVIPPAGWQLPRSLVLSAWPAPPPSASALMSLRRQFWFIALGVVLLVLVTAPLLARSLAQPFTQLVRATEAVARGERSVDVPQQGPPELVELGQSFAHMTQSLEEAELRTRAAERRGAWREIAQRIAHEIKNALSPLSLAVDNVETAVAAPTPRPDVIESSLATARDQLESLDRLVGEFRSFARVPQLNVGPLDPAALGAAAVEATQAVHPDTPISFSPGTTLPELRGDNEQLRRALGNLLRNAAEAAPGRPVLLEYGAGPADSQWWFQVTDQGPGLTDEQRARMGEPYYTTKPDGTGLGLAVVYQIVQAHGGDIRWLAPERGSQVKVVLPKSVEEPEA